MSHVSSSSSQPDYRIEHLKGAEGEGAYFSGGPIKLEIKFKCIFSSKIN